MSESQWIFSPGASAPGLPLLGRTVVVTRPEGQAKNFVEELRRSGATVALLPAIAVVEEGGGGFVETIQQGPTYDWVIVTSVNGVRALERALHESGTGNDLLASCAFAAIGPATAAALTALGYTAQVVPERYISDEIPALLGDLEGRRVLLPRADKARKALPKLLRERGAEVTETVAYRIVSNEDPEVFCALQHLADRGVPDYLTFTSPTTVEGFAGLLERANLLHWLSEIPVVCIGPITAAAVEKRGVHSVCIADEYTTGGLLDALISAELGLQRERENRRVEK
ncbi:uroporphyrinogen-III synthase [bacterium]|nr:uroporphyrinogen-III synthase [bacterium]